ncbi:MAG: cob(I)yrinic acid a,c-diamide adenosyltransferase [Verrucomicrobia bacterium]|nr:MAG: cob(I)yrinic acid a,c-diamide adenosyltransferase [Verrucomicrobiota bacterium]PYK67595.1 MAG: cob(I)yrinic acid a,c-diamide adenosyltransferase [Verrucomicrobiota bacterium]
MSIVTKTGDKGETSLMYGRRVPKSDTRVDAYGCLDELMAALGLARALSKKKFLSNEILAAQKDLIVVMGELATVPQDRARYVKDGFQLATTAMVDRITTVIVDLEKDKSLYAKDWAVPGATTVSAALDLARATCRRAERHIARFMAKEKDFNSEILRYINRLSDLCWVLARYAERIPQNRRTFCGN